jgi:hypothetical protein
MQSECVSVGRFVPAVRFAFLPSGLRVSAVLSARESLTPHTPHAARPTDTRALGARPVGLAGRLP